MTNSPRTLFASLRLMFAHLQRPVGARLIPILMLMLMGAVAELMTIGTVLPFLTFLLDSGGELTQFSFLREWFASLGFETRPEQTLAATILFITVALLAGAIRLRLIWVSQNFIFELGKEMGCAVFTHVLHLPYRYHVATNSSNVNASVAKVQAAVMGVFLPLMQAAIGGILAIFLIGALIAVNAKAAILTAIAAGAIYGAISHFARGRLRSNSQAIAAGQNRRFKTIQDGLGGIRDVIVDQTQEHFVQKYSEVEAQLCRAASNNAFLSAFPRVLIEAIGMVLVALLAFFLVSGSGGMSEALPTLGALALGAQRLLPLLQQVYVGWSNAQGNKQSVLDVLDLLEERRSEGFEAEAGAETLSPDEIVFSNVGYRYGPNTDWVVRGFSLSVPRGARVGIIGKTGSGKSTIMDLLMGLLLPEEGGIRVDGMSLDEHSRRAWQRQVAHVPQAIYLSDASLAENIAFGTDHHNINMERVRDAARRAELDGFIESLPRGYDTEVGERGVRLSGGQRQRIGIARALYKRASVIVFDEATSALDMETEAAVMRSIAELQEDLTVFIIAHRLSTVQGCGLVVRLSEGRIVQTGSYDEVVGATAGTDAGTPEAQQ